MNLSSLTKEQKQYIILGVLGLVTVIGLTLFGVRYSLSSVSTARVELFDLKSKIESADRVLSESDQTSADYDRTVKALQEYLENIPPERNYYSWATEVIYSSGRSAGLDIDSVDEISESRSVRTKDKQGIDFDAYSLRIRARGRYDNIKYFLTQITTQHPLVRVTGLEISSGNNPDMHEIHLFVQWPFHLEEIVKLWEEIAEKQRAIARRPVSNRKSASSTPEINPAESDDERGNGSEATPVQQGNLQLIASSKPEIHSVNRSF